MQSPSIEEPLYSHTPESNFSPSMKASQLNPAIDGSKEACWCLKHEEAEPSGYVFDSEVEREGSD